MKLTDQVYKKHQKALISTLTQPIESYEKVSSIHWVEIYSGRLQFKHASKTSKKIHDTTLVDVQKYWQKIKQSPSLTCIVRATGALGKNIPLPDKYFPPRVESFTQHTSKY